MSLPTSVTAGSLLDIWFTEALGRLLVTDPLRGAPEVAVAGLTVRVCEGAVAAVVTFPPLHVLLAVAVAAVHAAGHVACHRSVDLAVTLLTARDGVVAEGVLLTL